VETAYEMVSPQPNVAVLLGYGLEALATLNYPSDSMTESMVHYLLSKQQLDGHWSSNDNRPPMEDGAIQATAFAIRSVQRYPIPGRELECANRVQRASLWLRQAVPVTFNQRAFQLMGLGWAGAPPGVVQPLVEELLKRQNEDGGWSQLSGLPSDSWATGQALVAMHQAGRIDTSHPAFERGVDFLLRTQFDDGSWFVKSRTWPFQPHFDSGFPHGKDQWISAGGTAWACMALLLTQSTVDALPSWDWTGLTERVAIAEREGLLNERARMGKRSDGSASSAEGTSLEKVDFERQIKPVLERSCVACHSGAEPQGGLHLSTREGLLTHGESGEPAVVPFDRKQGLLLRYAADEVEDLEMPPLAERGRFPKLSRDEWELLSVWIDQGCEWPDACRLEAPKIDKEP
jgi:hypothetical protein